MPSLESGESSHLQEITGRKCFSILTPTKCKTPETTAVNTSYDVWHISCSFLHFTFLKKCKKCDARNDFLLSSERNVGNPQRNETKLLSILFLSPIYRSDFTTFAYFIYPIERTKETKQNNPLSFFLVVSTSTFTFTLPESREKGLNHFSLIDWCQVSNSTERKKERWSILPLVHH